MINANEVFNQTGLSTDKKLENNAKYEIHLEI
jgi:hypothetical protein